MEMRYFYILVTGLVLLSGCIFAPAGSNTELGDDYWSDFQYNPADGRTYHKTKPDARDMRDFRPRAEEAF
jgi:hypothetical protein